MYHGGRRRPWEVPKIMNRKSVKVMALKKSEKFGWEMNEGHVL